MRHIYSKEDGPTTFCGDHYCGGHKSTVVKCVCGWSMILSESGSEREKEEIKKIKHILVYEGLLEE